MTVWFGSSLMSGVQLFWHASTDTEPTDLSYRHTHVVTSVDGAVLCCQGLTDLPLRWGTFPWEADVLSSVRHPYRQPPLHEWLGVEKTTWLRGYENTARGQARHSAINAKLRWTQPKYKPDWDAGCFSSALRLFLFECIQVYRVASSKSPCCIVLNQ